MRHWGIGAGVALGATLGVSLGLIAWPIDAARVQRELAPFGLDGAPAVATLTLLPRPTLRLTHVKARLGAGALETTAELVEVPLRFDRLAYGEFAPLGVALQGAELRLDLDRAREALATLQGPVLSRLILRDGAVAVVSAAQGWSSRFDVASARLDMSSPEGPLRAAATGRWRTQPVEATLEIDAPFAAARGEPSPVRAALDAPLAQMRFAGEWSPAGRLDGALYKGQTSALIPSLNRFAHWLALPPLGAAPAGLELEARVTADFRQLKLADATLTLGGQPFEGALDILKAPKGLSVSGTLAADSLDLEALLGPPPALIDAAAWSKAPALPSPSDWADLDLRVSATRALWRGHAIENAAAAVSQRDGRIAVKLLDASLAKGSLSGEMSVDDSTGVCESKVSVSLENADLGALLADFGERNFTGQGGLKVAIRARGRSPADIIATADGEGSLEIADGALRHLNFEEALRRGQRRLIDVARDMNSGATRFGAAHGRVEISNGEARFVDAVTKAAGVSLALTGAVDLANRAWRAHLAARQSTDDGEPTPDGARLDFTLYGPWTGPVLAPLIPPAD